MCFLEFIFDEIGINVLIFGCVLMGGVLWRLIVLEVFFGCMVFKFEEWCCFFIGCLVVLGGMGNFEFVGILVVVCGFWVFLIMVRLFLFWDIWWVGMVFEWYVLWGGEDWDVEGCVNWWLCFWLGIKVGDDSLLLGE